MNSFGRHDGWIALALLILACLSFGLPRSTQPEWRYWVYALAPHVLFAFTIGFAISAVRQPQKSNKVLGVCILVLIVLGFLATPQIVA